MELRQRCCVAVAFCLYMVTRCSPQNSEQAHCKLSPLNQEFPGKDVPEKLQFMFFCRNCVSLPRRSRMLNEKSLCLQGNISTLIVRPCDVAKTSQKWFQLYGSLINIKYGYSIVIDTTNFVNVALGFFEWNHKPWTCSFKNNQTEFLALTRQTSNQTLYLSVDDVRANTVETSSQPNTFWGVANSNGLVTEKTIEKLCKKREAFCGSPIPGVRSFVVSAKNDYTAYLHLPQDKIYKAFQTGTKPCYSSGDFMLIGCPIGHVQIGTNDVKFKEITCLGGGVWSDPKPLHCRKRTCNPPITYKNSSFQESDFLYGDTVVYRCIEDYTGNDSIITCGPEGTWIGNPPTCLHFCDHQLSSARGVITSPNYPVPYPPALHCIWRISAPDKIRIALWFRDFFVEPGSVLPYACRFDVLLVRDSLAERNLRICGSSYPKHWFSNGSYIEVVFRSDSSYEGKGFKIEYTFWNDSVTVLPMEPQRNGSFPDEEDKTYIYTLSEYATYVIEGMYGLLVTMLLCFVIMVVIAHIVNSIKNKISPDEEEEQRKRQGAGRRRKAVAEYKESSKMESMNTNAELQMSANERLEAEEAACEDADFQQERSDKTESIQIANLAHFLSLESDDIAPQTLDNTEEHLDVLMTRSKKSLGEKEVTSFMDPETSFNLPGQVIFEKSDESLESKENVSATKRLEESHHKFSEVKADEDESTGSMKASQGESSTSYDAASEDQTEGRSLTKMSEVEKQNLRQSILETEMVIPSYQRPSHFLAKNPTINALFDPIETNDVEAGFHGFSSTNVSEQQRILFDSNETLIEENADDEGLRKYVEYISQHEKNGVDSESTKEKSDGRSSVEGYIVIEEEMNKYGD